MVSAVASTHAPAKADPVAALSVGAADALGSAVAAADAELDEEAEGVVSPPHALRTSAAERATQELTRRRGGWPETVRARDLV